ncbi:MAG: hypothetical protein P8P84_19565, partial [Paracoccaceae bacterium]|nr:hypothetical protein [Paracoccaceae bacterium]
NPSLYFMDKYCDPRSEWLTNPPPFSGHLWQIFRLNAARTKPVVIDVETRQPTILRADTSMTKAT